MPRHRKPSIGEKFGRLTVLRCVGTDGRRTLYDCQCSCGVLKVLVGSNLVSGDTKSCGCLRRELLTSMGNRSKIHGQSGNRLYFIWKAMLSRCENVNDPVYKHYGGRGINVCVAWHDLDVFLADVGLRPSSQHSLDRINNDGGYEPGNCRWATKKEQANNTRRHQIPAAELIKLQSKLERYEKLYGPLHA